MPAAPVSRASRIAMQVAQFVAHGGPIFTWENPRDLAPATLNVDRLKLR